MPIQGSLSLSDFHAAQRLHYWPKPWVAAFLILTVATLIVMAYVLHDWTPAIFLVYMAAVFFIYIPLRGRRSFRQHKALAEPMTIEIRDNGISFTSTHSNGLLPWSHINKWKSNNRITLIYRTSSMYHLIPKTFFQSPADYDAFVNELRAMATVTT